MQEECCRAPPEFEELERQRAALQPDIRELQIEHDLLKTARDLIKRIWPATFRA